MATAALTNPGLADPSRLKKSAAPFFWLSAFYVVYCARPEDWVHGLGVLPLAKITSAGAVLAFLFASPRGRRKLNELPSESYLLLALIGMLMLASLFSPVWRGGAVSRTLDFGKVWVIWILTFLLVTNLGRFRRILYIQAASVPLVSLLSIVKGHNRARLEGVLGGVYSNSNDLAFAVALSFPLCLMFLLTARSKFRKLLWTAGMLVMGAALVMTASRGGLITFVITAVICLWHFGVKGKRFYLIVATGLAGVVLISFAGKNLMDRMATLWGDDIHNREQYRAEKSLDERQFVIDKALEGIKEHPILGLGTRNFETYSTIWLEVHMTYLQIAVEGGIPSMILFLAFFYHGFKNARLLLKRNDLNSELKLVTGALYSVQIGFAVGALFSPEAYQFFPFFAVAYTSALLAYVRESDRAAAAASNPPLTPVRPLSSTFVNEGRVLANP